MSSLTTVPSAPERTFPLRRLRPLLDHPDYAALRDDPESFLRHPGGMHSPLTIPGMDEAVSLLSQAVESKGQILVIGDRDVDGVTSTALIANFLRENHSGPLELIVSDAGDDYGLSGQVLARALELRPALVILLDMGSSNGPEIEALAKQGTRVIVLDHHQLHDRVPDAALCAFANPMRSPEEERAEHGGKIATVGLAFKFLIGFALLHTREWKRVRIFGDGPVVAYRCGAWLGVFDDLEQARHEISQSYPDLDVPDQLDHELRLREAERARIATDPREGGRSVFSHVIASRPRLASFVARVSDLAAIGIVTDMVPLVGENRAIVRMGVGLRGSRGRRRFQPGLTALIKELGLGARTLVSRDLAWSVGPALNAAGRMGQTRAALDLLTAEDGEDAAQKARALVRLNEERKKRTARNEALVKEHFEKNPEKLERPLIFCYHPDLEPGVSGIVATRLTEAYLRPVVYINPDGPYARGSARTWDGINVLLLLDRASEQFIQFGGHPEAAGFSIEYDRIGALEEALLEAMQSVSKNEIEHRNVPAQSYHLLIRPEDIHADLLRELEHLEPFGPGNPEPAFGLKQVRVRDLRYPGQGRHACFGLEGGARNLVAVAWGRGEELKPLLESDRPLNLTGSIGTSSFRGRLELQFRLESITATE